MPTLGRWRMPSKVILVTAHSSKDSTSAGYCNSNRSSRNDCLVVAVAENMIIYCLTLFRFF